MLFIVLLLLAGDAATLHPLASPTPTLPGLTAVGAHLEKVMLQSVDPRQRMAFYLHDMPSGKTWEIGQDRLPKSVYRILPARDGYVLFAHLINQIYYLDAEAGITEHVQLADFQGVMPEMVVTDMFSMGPDVALLSFETNDSDQLFIARVDLVAKTLSLIGNFAQDGDDAQFGFVYPLGEKLLYVDKLSGSARFITPAGSTVGAEVFPALARVPMPGFNVEVSNKMEGRLKYRTRIRNPLPCSGGVSLDLISVFPTQYRQESRNSWVIEAEQVKRVEILELHSYQGRRLVFDLVSGQIMNLKK